MDKETLITEYKGVLIAGAAIIILGAVLLVSFLFSSKQIALKGSEKAISITAGDPLEIAWSSKNIKRVGIVLFYGDKPQWIVQNVDAAAGKYTWNSYIYQNAGSDYRLAVFEYPWRKGNAIAYSPQPIEILGQKYATCDDYSTQQGWLYLSDSYAGARKVFITSIAWTGNLGGLEGADNKCQQDAEKNDYTGKYVAFIGSDTVSAAERIKKDGVFMEAESIGTLPDGRGCHRFLASSVQKLLEISRLSRSLAQVELSETFNRRLGDVWFGRRTASAEAKCLGIPLQGVIDAYSGSLTCQDWDVDKKQVYYGTIPSEADLPRCYTLQGKNVMANYYGATASAVDATGALVLVGDTCDNSHRLMCVEQ